LVRMIAGRLITESTEVEPGVVVVNPTVTWNPSASVVEITLKDWNRDFTEGTLAEWTYVDADISTEDPHEGPFCVNLTQTGAYMVQTLDEPVPVYSVYEFSAWFKRKASGDAFLLEMRHTDGTVNQVGGSLTRDGWNRFWFDRSEMSPDKILSGIAIRSEVGDFYVDKVVLGIASEVMTGTVEVTQATAESLQAELRPRPKGGILETGSETTTDTYATIASVTVTDDKDFQLSKVVVSVEYATWIKYRWAAADISCERLMDEKTILLEHFPWDYEEMEGDGAKAFDVQAKWYEEEGIVNVESVGEEV